MRLFFCQLFSLSLWQAGQGNRKVGRVLDIGICTPVQSATITVQSDAGRF